MPVQQHQRQGVELRTVKALLTERALARIRPSVHRFCPEPTCDVVYFDDGGHPYVKTDIRVPVWQKERPGAHIVCYCFGENEADIRREIEIMGRSDAVERIRCNIQAGRCACEVRNPRGVSRRCGSGGEARGGSDRSIQPSSRNVIMALTKAGGAYQIGELATRSGLTPDTLRYYERVGLLPPPARTNGGFRMFPSQTLERLRFIKQAQTLGLTLQEIRDLVTYQDQGGLTRCRHVRDLLQTKLVELQQRLSALAEFRDTLSRYLDECERTLGSGRGSRRAEPECPVIETLKTR